MALQMANDYWKPKMTLFCPACNAVLPLAIDGGYEQVCVHCGERVPVDSCSPENVTDGIEASDQDLVEETERRSAEVASRFQHRIPPRLNALAEEFHFSFGMGSFPRPTRQQVVAIAGLLFQGRTGSVMEMLDRIESEDAPLRERLQLDVLKLADRDISKVEFHVAQANSDVRDVIMPAETPLAYGMLQRRGMAALAADTLDEIAYIAESDLMQYLNWLDSVIGCAGHS